MITDKPIYNLRKVGGDYFELIHARLFNKKLTDYLPLFNFDDYYCYKTTRYQVIVDYETFINFEYAGYTFFRKDLYKKEHVERWIEYTTSLGGIQYLGKPTPPFPPEKIIIRK